MKSKKVIFISIITSIILLMPIKIENNYNVRYKSILYEVVNYSPLDVEGVEVYILGIEVFSNVKPVGLILKDCTSL